MSVTMDTLQFRQTLSRFAAGVTVVTLQGNAETPLGFTATAFCSLSLDPPLTLVCARKGKPTHQALVTADSYVINILAADQEKIAQRFADPNVVDRFSGLDKTRGVLGAPILGGTAAWVECRLRSVLDGGDHSIFIGEAENLWNCDAAPLLHFAGGFVHLEAGPPDPFDQRAEWLVDAAW